MIYTLILRFKLHKAQLCSASQPVVTRFWAHLLREEDGLEFSQPEYTTCLVIPHMDVRLVLMKF